MDSAHMKAFPGEQPSEVFPVSQVSAAPQSAKSVKYYPPPYHRKENS
jgi:hypothetical protein